MTCAGAIALVIGASSGARADGKDAQSLLKGMSDYLSAQKAMSLQYDAVFEVVTKDHEKIQLATSGSVILSRPDKIRSTRQAGFADVETVFDGKTLSILGKNANVYVQADVPGTVENLVDQLREKFHRQLPGADLLLPNFYDAVMPDVTEIMDLGSGVVGGAECDHLAFRAKETDWQIWIAQGDTPYPCRYVITSKTVDQSPEYSVQIHDWKAGDQVAADDFSFKPPADAKKIDIKDIENLKGTGEFPENFKLGEVQ